MIRTLMNPGKAKLEEIMARLETLKELLRRYEGRRSIDGATRNLDEEVKMAAVESMLPDALETHVMLNRSRINTFDLLIKEIQLYVESKGGLTIRELQSNQGPTPMDVDSVAVNSLAASARCFNCG